MGFEEFRGGVGGGGGADAEVGGEKWSGLGEEVDHVSGLDVSMLKVNEGVVLVSAHCSAIRKGSSAFIVVGRM